MRHVAQTIAMLGMGFIISAAYRENDWHIVIAGFVVAIAISVLVYLLAKKGVQ